MSRILVACLLALSACGLRDLVPRGPVHLGGAWKHADTEPMTYSAGPIHDTPVLPVQVFGMAYDLDLVVRPRDRTWDMLELARFQTPHGAEWIALDTYERTGHQVIVTGHSEIATTLPEISLPRKLHPFTVDDRSEGDRIDLSIHYVNAEGQSTALDYRGSWPRRSLKRRNASTMNHSPQRVQAVLDLSERRFGRGIDLAMASERTGVKRILGIIPFRLAIVQTQTGFSAGRYTIRTDGDTLRTVHPVDAASPTAALTHETEQTWTRHAHADAVEWTQRSPFRSLRYRFAARQGAEELVEIVIEQFEREHPVGRYRFHPPLPDLRRPFEGTVVRDFAIDVNGQESHGKGQVAVYWDQDVARLAILADAPRWARERPFLAEVRPDRDGAWRVEIAPMSPSAHRVWKRRIRRVTGARHNAD